MSLLSAGKASLNPRLFAPTPQQSQQKSQAQRLYRQQLERQKQQNRRRKEEEREKLKKEEEKHQREFYSALEKEKNEGDKKGKGNNNSGSNNTNTNSNNNSGSSNTNSNSNNNISNNNNTNSSNSSNNNKTNNNNTAPTNTIQSSHPTSSVSYNSTQPSSMNHLPSLSFQSQSSAAYTSQPSFPVQAQYYAAPPISQHLTHKFQQIYRQLQNSRNRLQIDKQVEVVRRKLEGWTMRGNVGGYEEDAFGRQGYGMMYGQSRPVYAQNGGQYHSNKQSKAHSRIATDMQGNINSRVSRGLSDRVQYGNPKLQYANSNPKSNKTYLKMQQSDSYFEEQFSKFYQIPEQSRNRQNSQIQSLSRIQDEDGNQAYSNSLKPVGSINNPLVQASQQTRKKKGNFNSSNNINTNYNNNDNLDQAYTSLPINSASHLDPNLALQFQVDRMLGQVDGILKRQN